MAESGRKAPPTPEPLHLYFMNPTATPQPKPRRRVGWWVALGFGLLFAPVIFLGVAAYSLVTLNADAAVLRREVMAATDAKWHTKVQLDIGGITLGAVRAGLKFVHHENIAEARLALKAVRCASVGVYETNVRITNIARSQLFSRTDALMQRRGWTRLVGVAEDNETVLIYTSDVTGSDRRIDLCLAVVDGRQLVIVSTRVDAEVLAELAARHLPKDGLREKVKLSQLSF